MWQHGHFHWNELMTSDPEAAKTFYGDTLGWTFDAMPMGDYGMYWICKDGDQPVGGLMDVGNAAFEGAAPCWLPYLAVDNVDERLEKATKAGASIMQPVVEIPGIGRIAIIKDPTGNMIGWMTPASQDS